MFEFLSDYPINPNSLSHLVKKHKEVLNIFYFHNVVDKISCNSCSFCYIGQTERSLLTRIKEPKVKFLFYKHSPITKH